MMTYRGRHVSPAGSVGASASQRCPPDTHTLGVPYWLISMETGEQTIFELLTKEINDDILKI